MPIYRNPKFKFNSTVLGTLTVSTENDNATTVANTFSDFETASTKIMTTFATTTVTVTLSPGTVYIAVGGVLFSLIMAVVLGVYVIAGLLVRRVKHNAITKQLTDAKSKSPKQTPSCTSGTFNFKLESPILEVTP
jgi:hypothetical protein